MSQYVVRDLFVYPLKSAAGTRVTRADLDRFGFIGDRRWMVVDADGRFLSQRELPRMALLQAHTRPDGLTLDAPGMPTLHLTIPAEGSPPQAITIWDDRCQAREAPAAASWISTFLEHTSRVVYAPPEMLREVDPEYAGAGGHVAFTDGYPLLLIGQGSLDDVNARLAAAGAAPVPMNRFRPNVVIDGAPPYAEDRWRRLSIGPPDAAVTLDIVKPCARCAIVPVDQATGIRGTEPLTTLSTYRRRHGKVYFGQNVMHRSTGTIRVGDPVRVIEEVDAMA